MTPHSLRLCLEGWEDGQAVQCWLCSPDRAQAQAAERLTAELRPGVTLTIHQQPGALVGSRGGVGFAVWDSALVLTAYLAAQPPATFEGVRCVELGAGVGLVGLALARLGAQVTLTDRPPLVPLLRRNIARNWLSSPNVRHDDGGQPRGSANAAALDWDSPGSLASLAQPPLDLIVASDCVYDDPAGVSPDASHFAAAAAGLCNAGTRVLVAFEIRGEQLRAAFLSAVTQRFSRVQQIPRESMPEPYRVEHVELYELRL